MTAVTTDFAISYLLDDCGDCPENKDGECMTQSHCFEVKRMAIKALRLMNKAEVLDKIRAEIKSISPKTYPFLNSTDNYVKEDDVLQIIDKYREVSE